MTLAACEPAQQPPQQPLQQPTGTQSPPSGTQARQPDPTITQAGEALAEQGKRFVEDAEKQLRDMRDKITEALGREDLGETARNSMRSAAEQLQERIGALEGELRRLREEGEKAWREAEPKVRSALDEASSLFDRFRETYLSGNGLPVLPRLPGR